MQRLCSSEHAKVFCEIPNLCSSALVVWIAIQLYTVSQMYCRSWMAVCFWFQNFSVSRYFPAYLWHCIASYIYTAKRLEQRFGTPAGYSYSPGNIQKGHRFGHIAFDKILCFCCCVLIMFIAIFLWISWEILILHLMKYSCCSAFESMASHGRNTANPSIHSVTGIKIRTV